MYRKLDSAIMVVKAAEDRLRRDGADVLNRAMKRGVLIQRPMSPQLIIIGGICAKDSAQKRRLRLVLRATQLSPVGPP